MSHIIFLHGPSSSGKSTLADAIRAVSSTPYLHLSIDHFRDSGAWLPNSYRNWSQARSAFFAGFHASLAAFADAGNDLIVEHILDTVGWQETLQRLFCDHKVLFVGLTTPVGLLISREARRQNRDIGSAERDFAHVHNGLRYDLTFSREESPETQADVVLEHIGTTQRSKSSSSNFFQKTE